jgi:hypothetical protein
MSRAAIAADAKREEEEKLNHKDDEDDEDDEHVNGNTPTAKKRTGPSEDEIIRRFVVFCINCNHGFHANHAKAWFERHRVCPVAECSCVCDR